jgi:hypothetical protein
MSTHEQGGSRHGQMPVGFSRQGLQLPDELVKAFRAEAARLGSGGIKDAGTLAISVWMGMPERVRRAMYFWAREAWYDNTSAVTPEIAWRKLVDLLRDLENAVVLKPEPGAGGVPMVTIEPMEPVVGATHRVAKIVHPATPPPKPGSKRKAAEG